MQKKGRSFIEGLTALIVDCRNKLSRMLPFQDSCVTSEFVLAL